MLLTIDEVAAQWRTTRSSVRRMWYAGLCPKPIRIGRRGIRWRKADVEEFLASRQQLPQPAEKKETVQ